MYDLIVYPNEYALVNLKMRYHRCGRSAEQYFSDFVDGINKIDGKSVMSTETSEAMLAGNAYMFGRIYQEIDGVTGFTDCYIRAIGNVVVCIEISYAESDELYAEAELLRDAFLPIAG